MLHQHSVDCLMEFSWSVIMEEMRVHAPVLLKILKHSTSTKCPRPNHQVIHVSLVLYYAGHSSKQVCPCFLD